MALSSGERVETFLRILTSLHPSLRPEAIASVESVVASVINASIGSGDAVVSVDVVVDSVVASVINASIGSVDAVLSVDVVVDSVVLFVDLDSLPILSLKIENSRKNWVPTG